MDSKNFWMLPAVLPLALAIANSAGAGNPAAKLDAKNTQLRTPKVAQYDLSVMDDATPEVAKSRAAAWMRGSKGLPLVPGNRTASPRGSSGVDTLERIDYSYVTGTMAGGAGEIASDASFRPNISSDGAFSVFTSLAQNLTADDALGFAQCYRVNNTTGAIEMVSKTTANGPGNGNTGVPTFKGDSVLSSSMFINGISNDGARVSFTSEADNLVAGDTNGVSDVFVWDSAGPTVTRASVTTAGAQLTGASWDGWISGDGNSVAFTSVDLAGNTAGFTADPDAAGVSSLVGRQIGSNVFVRNISGATTTLVSHGFGTPGTGANSDSRRATISDDGTRVAYESRALNLLATAKTSVSAVFGNQSALTSIYMWSSGTNTNEMVDREDSTGGISDNAGDSWGPYISRNGRFVTYVSRKPLFASTGASRVICTDMNSLTWWTTHRQMNTDTTGAAALVDAGYRFSWNPWISDDGLVSIMSNKPISADGFGDWDQVRAKVTATATTTVSAADPFHINTAVGGALVDSGIYRWGSGHDKGQSSRPMMSSDKTKFVFAHNSGVLDGQTGGLTNVYLGTVDGSMTVTAMTRISRGTTNGGTVAFEEESKEHESNFQMPAISPNGKYVVYVSRASASMLESLPFASRPWNAGGYFAGVNDEQMFRVDTETGEWGLASYGVFNDGSGDIYPMGLGDPLNGGIGNLYSFDDLSGFVVASGLYPIQDFALEQNNEAAHVDLAYGFGPSHIYELGFAPSVSNDGEVAFWNPGYNDGPDGPMALSWAPLDSYFLFVNNPSTGTTSAVMANGGDFVRNTTSHIVPLTERTHISADGRYLGYTSDAIDVVIPDDNAGVNRQAYVYDRNTSTNRLVARRRDTGTGLGVTTEITGGESFLLGLSSDGQKALWADVSAGNIFDPSFSPDSIGQLFLFNDAASGAANDGVGTMQCVSTNDAGAAVADSSGTPFTGFFSGATMSQDAAVVAFLGAIDQTTATGESGPAVGVQAYRKTVGANSGTGVLGALTLLSKASGAPFVDGTDGINTLNMAADGSQIVFPSDVAAGFSTNPAVDSNGAQWDVFRIASGSPGVVTIDSIEPTNGQTDIGTSLPAAVSQRGSTTRVVFNSDADTVFNAGSASINSHLWLHTYSVAAADAGSWTMYE